MEVLEHGDARGSFTYTVKCGYCQTKFRFFTSESEPVYDPRDDKDGDYLLVKCPVCSRFNTINFNDHDKA